MLTMHADFRQIILVRQWRFEVATRQQCVRSLGKLFWFGNVAGDVVMVTPSPRDPKLLSIHSQIRSLSSILRSSCLPHPLLVLVYPAPRSPCLSCLPHHPILDLPCQTLCDWAYLINEDRRGVTISLWPYFTPVKQTSRCVTGVMSAAASTTTTCHSATSHRVAATWRLTLRRWLDKEKMESNGTTRWMVLIHWMILIHWTTVRLVDDCEACRQRSYIITGDHFRSSPVISRLMSLA